MRCDFNQITRAAPTPAACADGLDVCLDPFGDFHAKALHVEEGIDFPPSCFCVVTCSVCAGLPGVIRPLCVIMT